MLNRETIAVIDDDIPIGNMIEDLLRREGYDVLRAYSGTEALMLFDRAKPDLALLDLMLPGMSGEEVLARIPGVPVIVVSAKGDVEGKVDLLLGGAADYITKPFDTKELLARIRVQLRGRAPGGAELSFGEISLDAAAREVRAGGSPVKLTRTEFAILRALMEHKGQVVSKSAIMSAIERDTPDCEESSLKTHVGNLRAKLRAQTGRDCIEAVWGIGYRMKS